ncbi:Uncharacterised protein [Legionella lansingensis]|uniref:Transmembrane protein n=1 Tax=Legionella lansingensis TaxID=45067 RepID=A0A0W0VEI8_9GAMM|nr:hypothetical protein [Legionella lansingensis]KTD18556.1 hypothetical protein Llan_2514 [Legionella lansingensis]SNV51234.1 Uncharacterised protein [Legionella lansingensis]
MNKNIPLMVAGFVFALVAIAHLLRIIFKWEIVASGYVLPMNVSYIGFVVTVLLSLWMFLASRK